MMVRNAKADRPFMVPAMFGSAKSLMEPWRGASIKGLTEFLLHTFSSINNITAKIQHNLNWGSQCKRKRKSNRQNSICRWHRNLYLGAGIAELIRMDDRMNRNHEYVYVYRSTSSPKVVRSVRSVLVQAGTH